MTHTIQNPETRRRLALGLTIAPANLNHKRRHPLPWLLAAALRSARQIAAILATLIR